MRHRRGNGDYNLYSILFTVCEVAFDNFFIKEFYDDDGELTCHTGSETVLGLYLPPAKVTFPPLGLPQPVKAGIFDSAIPEGCKAELT